mmetsp:Transcript_24282/g.53992  ORF Transcript_24282/g.53992 Transcript_24282/m.53992 type:complete len:259 (+) Transcript_24282:1831-2607(+)
MNLNIVEKSTIIKSMTRFWSSSRKGTTRRSDGGMKPRYCPLLQAVSKRRAPSYSGLCLATKLTFLFFCPLFAGARSTSDIVPEGPTRKARLRPPASPAPTGRLSPLAFDPTARIRQRLFISGSHHRENFVLPKNFWKSTFTSCRLCTKSRLPLALRKRSGWPMGCIMNSFGVLIFGEFLGLGTTPRFFLSTALLWRSYLSLLVGLLKVSYAQLMSRILSSARGRSAAAILSGCHIRTRRRYAFLMAAASASSLTCRVA